MKRYLLFLILIMSQLSYGQRESAIWYFGEQAGMSFENGAPEPLLDGQIDSFEGCATIASSEGALLFYTNGEQVWDRNHTVMPGGSNIGGNVSGTQAAIIVPQPNTYGRYYIFTPDAVQFYYSGGNGGGLKYSIVDITQNSGTVVESAVQLLPQASEKITAVAAANEEDIWVITYHEDSFYSYRVTENGLNPTPVISQVDYIIDDFNNIRGSLKASPNGDKLAITHTIFQPDHRGDLLLYDFNTTTGVVSNQEFISDEIEYYGVAFSSDGSKLYASGKVLNNTTTSLLRVHQFDLSTSDIPGSRYEVVEIQTSYLSDISGALELALDKRIYYALPNSTLSYIKQPNELGPDCSFFLKAYDLGGRRSTYGLPQFIQSYFESIFDVAAICFGQTTQFTLFEGAAVESVVWDFGDPSSGIDNSSTLLNPTHYYATAGSYIVTATVTFSNGRPPKTFAEIVDIRLSPELPEQIILKQCDLDGNDDGLSIFNLNEIDYAYEGIDEDFTAEFYATYEDAVAQENSIAPVGYYNSMNNEIIYTRVYSDERCFLITEVRLEVVSASDGGIRTLELCDLGNFGSPQVTIAGIRAQLQMEFPNNDTALYFSLEDALLEQGIITIENYTIRNLEIAELYYRVESENECDLIGGLLFNILPPLSLEDKDFYLCTDSQQVTLTVPGDFEEYIWSNGATSRAITVDEVGVYTLDVKNGPGCMTSAEYTVGETPSLELSIVVNDFRQKNEIHITASSEVADLLYSIDDGASFQDSGDFLDVIPKNYKILVQDRQGCLYAEEIVTVRGAPRFFTPNNDGVNDVWQIHEAYNYVGLAVQVFDRYGKKITSFSYQDRGWDGTFDGVPLAQDNYWYSITYQGNKYTGYFVLIR